MNQSMAVNLDLALFKFPLHLENEGDQLKETKEFNVNVNCLDK